MTSRPARALLILVICALAPLTPAGQGKMATYQLVLLKKGPNAPATPPVNDELQQQHLAYLQKLSADGVGVASGPVSGTSDIRGIIIMNVASAQKARALAEADVTVKAGRHTVEVLSFLSPPGWFGKPPNFLDLEQLYFGFLKVGPDRSQDAATAKRLQAEHLAYMDDQHKQGKLVLAGPISEGGGDRRGIVVYRVASPAEAKTRAEADPMVKVGRLAVDLHPWLVSKGVLR